MTAATAGSSLKYRSIAKNDQLNDQIALGGEIEREHQWIGPAPLIVIAVDIRRYDEIPIVVDHLGYVHRQLLADDIALRPLSDGLLSLIVS
jgi:hypothetical protein